MLPPPPIPEPNTTENNVRLLKLLCLCHTAPLLCCAGLGYPSILALCCRFGCWTQSMWVLPAPLLGLLRPAPPGSVQLHLAPFSSAALGFSPAWIPCGTYSLAPSPSLSTTSILSIPYSSAFQHHSLELQLRVRDG